MKKRKKGGTKNCRLQLNTDIKKAINIKSDRDIKQEKEREARQKGRNKLKGVKGKD